MNFSSVGIVDTFLRHLYERIFVVVAVAVVSYVRYDVVLNMESCVGMK